MSLPPKNYRKTEHAKSRANAVFQLLSNASVDLENPFSSSQTHTGPAPVPTSTATQNGPMSMPPPIPPRPQGLSLTSTYRSGHPLSYTFGRYSVPSSYGAYNSYGDVGYGMGRFGYSHGYPHHFSEMSDAESAFLRMAEESSRPAFQSIESLVAAVGSISMMLESTYHAVYNSYRAVLGVVESFSRLRNHLAHVLSTLALLRAFQWLIKHVLYYLRLRKTDPSVEAAWSAATAATATATSGEVAPHSSWPIVIFLSVVFGAPWLLFRIFSKLALKKQQDKALPDTGEIHAVALYDFHAAHAGEVTIKPGQQLMVAPKSLQPRAKGWTMVHVDSHKSGLVPSNYIRMYRKKVINTTKPINSPGITENQMGMVFDSVTEETKSNVGGDS